MELAEEVATESNHSCRWACRPTFRHPFTLRDANEANAMLNTSCTRSSSVIVCSTESLREGRTGEGSRRKGESVGVEVSSSFVSAGNYISPRPNLKSQVRTRRISVRVCLVHLLVSILTSTSHHRPHTAKRLIEMHPAIVIFLSVVLVQAIAAFGKDRLQEIVSLPLILKSPTSCF